MPQSGTIYGLSDPRTNEVRYVGWAKKATKRFRGHMNEAKSDKEIVSWKVRWIRTLLKLKLEPVLVILQQFSTNALKAEVRWIKKLREQGCRLTNMTDGGEGVINLPEEVLIRLRNKTADRWEDPVWRKKNIDAQREARKDPKFRERCSEGAKKFARRKGERALRSQLWTDMWKDPVFKERTGKNISKALMSRPDSRKSISDKAKARWADPEFKKRVAKKIRKTMLARQKDPDIKLLHANHSKRMKKKMNDPAARKQISESLKKFNQQKKAAVKA
jgi:hypothetical protein